MEGIYRHVWLNSASSLHVAPWGVYAPAIVHTIRSLSTVLVADADVVVRTSVVNSDKTSHEFVLRTQIRDPETDKLLKISTMPTARLSGENETTYEQVLDLTDVTLWDIKHPKLYSVETIIATTEGSKLDTVNTTIGIRSIRFDHEEGFFLNERPVKIKGMANHQEFAGVGNAVPDALQP